LAPFGKPFIGGVSLEFKKYRGNYLTQCGTHPLGGKPLWGPKIKQNIFGRNSHREISVFKKADGDIPGVELVEHTSNTGLYRKKRCLHTRG